MTDINAPCKSADMRETNTQNPINLGTPFVRRRRTAAYWYAVGHADATGERDYSSEFERFASQQAAAYEAEQRAFMASVPDQWAEFIADRPMHRHAFVAGDWQCVTCGTNSDYCEEQGQ